MPGDESYDEHDEVRAWLAAEPAPRMPEDVASRLHATLAEESRLRVEGAATDAVPGDAESGDTESETATVTPLRRPGRWKAPLLAAAAVVAVIAVAVPVIDQASEQSAGDAAKSAVQAGEAPDTMRSGESDTQQDTQAAPMLEEPSLTRADFDADVREQVERSDLHVAPAAASVRTAVDCSGGTPTSPHGRTVTLDGDPAVLLASRSSGVVPGVEVYAVVCGADGPRVAARTTLPDR